MWNNAKNTQRRGGTQRRKGYAKMQGDNVLISSFFLQMMNSLRCSYLKDDLT